jgi:hypothetical protein
MAILAEGRPITVVLKRIDAEVIEGAAVEFTSLPYAKLTPVASNDIAITRLCAPMLYRIA